MENHIEPTVAARLVVSETRILGVKHQSAKSTATVMMTVFALKECAAMPAQLKDKAPAPATQNVLLGITQLHVNAQLSSHLGIL